MPLPMVMAWTWFTMANLVRRADLERFCPPVMPPICPEVLARMASAEPMRIGMLSVMQRGASMMSLVSDGDVECEDTGAGGSSIVLPMDSQPVEEAGGGGASAFSFVADSTPPRPRPVLPRLGTSESVDDGYDYVDPFSDGQPRSPHLRRG